MRIPVVLPVVRIHVEHDGHLEVAIDNQPYDQSATRSDLDSLLQAITTDLDTAVRVEVTEADGTTYADIVTPPTTQSAVLGSTPAIAPSGLSGRGFQPGEDIAVAYVVAHQTADTDGSALLRLPAAVVDRCREVVLVGLTSGTVANLGTPECAG